MSGLHATPNSSSSVRGAPMPTTWTAPVKAAAPGCPKPRFGATNVAVASARTHAHGAAEEFEVPGDHEAIAAVVAPAAGDGHRTRAGPQPGGEFGGATARIFHEDDAREAEFGDRAAVEVANERPRQGGSTAG